MAIAFSNADSATGITVSSLTFSHAVSGADRFLFVGVSHAEFPAVATSTVTYDSVGLTELWDFNLPIGDAYSNSGHYLVAPNTGTHDVVITLAGTSDEIYGGAISLTGVHQSTPIGTHATADGTASPATVDVTSATGELVIDNLFAQWTGITIGAGQTERWSENTAFSFGKGSTEAGAATVTMSWTKTAGANNAWNLGAVPVKPAPEGHPTMRRWMNVPGMILNRPQIGRR